MSAHEKFCAVQICCMDGRLDEFNSAWRAELRRQHHGFVDPVTNAGGVIDLIEPSNGGPPATSLVARDLKIAIAGHGIREIYIQIHRDCGALGGSAAFDSLEVEYNVQLDMLHQAATIIRQLFPEIVHELRIHGQWLELVDAKSNTWSLSDLGLL